MSRPSTTPPVNAWHQKNERITQAKQICRRCPVISQCATWALRTREPYGVWGGLSETERAEHPRRAEPEISGPRVPVNRLTRRHPDGPGTTTTGSSAVMTPTGPDASVDHILAAAHHR